MILWKRGGKMFVPFISKNKGTLLTCMPDLRSDFHPLSKSHIYIAYLILIFQVDVQDSLSMYCCGLYLEFIYPQIKNHFV